MMQFKALIRSCYRFLRKTILHSLIPPSHAPFRLDQNDIIEVIGFFETFSGIGESARLCASSLKKAGYNVVCTSVEQAFRKQPDAPWSFENASQDKKVTVRIFHLNPPMLPPVILSLGLKNFLSTYNIGYWAWELEVIPKEWIKSTRYMNAILTPSDFTSNAIRKYTNKTVITVLHPVTLDAEIANIDMREKLGIDKDTFLVSSVFSFGSAMDRKNPQAAISAFQKAFGANDNVALVLKSNSGTPEQKLMIKKLAGSYKNIYLYDEFWTTEQVRNFIATSNLYISLHRSEGFGLTIAEAMLMNTPVMVTNWSGNTGFCDAENSFLVNYKLIPVISDHPEFNGLMGANWADADTDEAAALLKNIYKDQALLKHISEAANLSLSENIKLNDYSLALQRLSEYEISTG